MIECIRLLDMPAAAADNRDELTLVVELLRDVWTDDGSTVTDQAGVHAREQGRVVRLHKAAFTRVIEIVQSDANDFFGVRNRRKTEHGRHIDRITGEQFVVTRGKPSRTRLDQVMKIPRIAGIVRVSPDKFRSASIDREATASVPDERGKSHLARLLSLSRMSVMNSD